MAITGGNWTAGNPPFNFPHKPAPRPLNAVADRDTILHGDLVANRVVGAPVAEEVAIDIDGENLIAIIADLRTRLAALEA